MTRNEYIASIMLEAADLLREDYCEDDDIEILDEAAQFSLLPRFKKMSKTYPELEESESLIKEVNQILISEGKNPTDKWYFNLFKILLKVLKYLASVASVLLMPLLIIILPVIPYMVNRLIAYLSEFGYTEISKNDLSKAIVELNKVRERVTDKDKKEKLNSLYDKMTETYKKLDN